MLLYSACPPTRVDAVAKVHVPLREFHHGPVLRITCGDLSSSTTYTLSSAGVFQPIEVR